MPSRLLQSSALPSNLAHLSSPPLACPTSRKRLSLTPSSPHISDSQQEMFPVSNEVTQDRLTDFKIKCHFLTPIHLSDPLETCHDLENTDYIIKASFLHHHKEGNPIWMRNKCNMSREHKRETLLCQCLAPPPSWGYLWRTMTSYSKIETLPTCASCTVPHQQQLHSLFMYAVRTDFRFKLLSKVRSAYGLCKKSMIWSSRITLRLQAKPSVWGSEINKRIFSGLAPF